jgi:hypothetical protein
MKQIILLIVCFSLFPFSCIAQEWKKLIALESNRDTVEEILGKPEKYFDTYGTYKTKEGKFSVWYSKGGCHKNFEGLQYDIPAQKMTGLLIYPSGKGLPLESYVSNTKEYKKQQFPGGYARYFYTSFDESTVFGTILKKDGAEFVYTIEIQPSKKKQHLLCKSKK